MSITKLSVPVAWGRPASFAFCRTVGVGGGSEVQDAALPQHAGPRRPGERPLRQHRPGGRPVYPGAEVLQTNIRALTETAALVDTGEPDRAVSYLSATRQVIFFGVEASLMAAMKAARRFQRTEPAVCVNDAHVQAMLAAAMTQEDTWRWYSSIPAQPRTPTLRPSWTERIGARSSPSPGSRNPLWGSSPM